MMAVAKQQPEQQDPYAYFAQMAAGQQQQPQGLLDPMFGLRFAAAYMANSGYSTVPVSEDEKIGKALQYAMGGGGGKGKGADYRFQYQMMKDQEARQEALRKEQKADQRYEQGQERQRKFDAMTIEQYESGKAKREAEIERQNRLREIYKDRVQPGASLGVPGIEKNIAMNAQQPQGILAIDEEFSPEQNEFRRTAYAMSNNVMNDGEQEPLRVFNPDVLTAPKERARVEEDPNLGLNQLGLSQDEGFNSEDSMMQLSQEEEPNPMLYGNQVPAPQALPVPPQQQEFDQPLPTSEYQQPLEDAQVEVMAQAPEQEAYEFFSKVPIEKVFNENELKQWGDLINLDPVKFGPEFDKEAIRRKELYQTRTREREQKDYDRKIDQRDFYNRYEKEFQAIQKPSIEKGNVYKGLAALADKEDGASHLALIKGFIRMFDTGIVTDAEVNQVMGSAGGIEYLRNIVNKWTEGSILTPKMRNNMIIAAQAGLISEQNHAREVMARQAERLNELYDIPADKLYTDRFLPEIKFANDIRRVQGLKELSPKEYEKAIANNEPLYDQNFGMSDIDIQEQDAALNGQYLDTDGSDEGDEALLKSFANPKQKPKVKRQPKDVDDMRDDDESGVMNWLRGLF